LGARNAVGDRERVAEDGFRWCLALDDPGKELAGTPARGHHPFVLVEDKHDFAALLDEYPAALSICRRLGPGLWLIAPEQSFHQSFTTPTPLSKA
jgi:hypothetical protein